MEKTRTPLVFFIFQNFDNSYIMNLIRLSNDEGVEMMLQSAPKRQAILDEEKWDLTHLVKDEATFEKALPSFLEKAQQLQQQWQGNVQTAEDVLALIKAYEAFETALVPFSEFAMLDPETDATNTVAQERYAKMAATLAQMNATLSFIETDILALSEDVLAQAKQLDETYTHFITRLIERKAHLLHPETEKALASLQETINAPYGLYNTTKLTDIQFPNFDVDGKSYPNSYNLFEGDWEVEENTAIRRAAFDAFSKQLKLYENTTAKTYQTHVKTEKTIATLRGYDSVIDYLLANQEVDRDLYNRQIDITMKELAPHMRRYAQLLKKVHGLDFISIADLKVSLDPEFEPTITVEQSRDYLKKALHVLGDDYLSMIDEAFDNRWIDFAQNEGKSTGAFCASPYGYHSYILISWTSRMNEVFVLAHELGHAGHFRNAQRAQTLFNSESSTYFVEAPSTMNEMLMANYLLKSSDDPRFKRWVISTIIARTYFHNFVTHLLEAAYQRKVYDMIDAGGSVNAETLNNLFREVLETFWGEDVVINEGAELTWMRQPHYYMGLYPYTYSAGLTISTQVSQRILHDEAGAVDDWLKTLQLGGSVSPVELAKTAGVDITTDKPLKDTIAFIGSLVDQLEQLTAEIGD